MNFTEVPNSTNDDLAVRSTEESQVDVCFRHARIVAAPEGLSSVVGDALVGSEVRILDKNEVQQHAIDYVWGDDDVAVAKGLLIRALRDLSPDERISDKEISDFDHQTGSYIRLEKDSYAEL
ncbi:MAG: hypothetical protein ACI92I_000113 [Acidimicrobiales bacterium]|jgi:hypothetical protein